MRDDESAAGPAGPGPPVRLDQLLGEVSDLDPGEQVAVFEELHAGLSARLSEQPE